MSSKNTLPFRVVIVGSSFGGLSALLKLVYQTDVPIEIIVIEPKTAFEYIPCSWEILSSGDNVWTLPGSEGFTESDQNGQNDKHMNTNNTKIEQLEILKHIQAKFGHYFLIYRDLPVMKSPNVFFYNGTVLSIGENSVTFASTPNLNSSPPTDCIKRVNKSVQREINSQDEFNDTGNDVAVFEVNFNILITASGSTSVQPIHTISQYQSLTNLVKAFGSIDNDADDIFLKLVHFFQQKDFTILQTFPQTFQLSIQSLCYLPDPYIKFLITYYFPDHTINQNNWEDYKIYSFICFFTTLAPAQLHSPLLRALPNDNPLNALIKSILSHETKQIPKRKKSRTTISI